MYIYMCCAWPKNYPDMEGSPPEAMHIRTHTYIHIVLCRAQEVSRHGGLAMRSHAYTHTYTYTLCCAGPKKYPDMEGLPPEAIRWDLEESRYI
jgi:hypothetical protein